MEAKYTYEITRDDPERGSIKGDAQSISHAMLVAREELLKAEESDGKAQVMIVTVKRQK